MIKRTKILFWIAIGWTAVTLLGGGFITGPIAVLVWIAWLSKKLDKHIEG